MILHVGCQGLGSKRHFREEVQLSSGEVVVVNRQFESRVLGGIGHASGWTPTYQSLELTNPRNGLNPALWESTAGVFPLIFDRDPASGEWFLLASISTCESWKAVGEPKLPYAEFRFRGGLWEMVDFSPRWVGREANVLTALNSDGEPKLVKLAFKAEKMGDLRNIEYSVRIVDSWQNNCLPYNPSLAPK